MKVAAFCGFLATVYPAMLLAHSALGAAAVPLFLSPAWPLFQFTRTLLSLGVEWEVLTGSQVEVLACVCRPLGLQVRSSSRQPLPDALLIHRIPGS